MTSRWLFSVCLCALSCGGGAAPRSPLDEDFEATEAPLDEAADPVPDTDEPAPERASSSAPATPPDVAIVLQLVIDDEALQPFLGLEKPERFPLRIAGDLPAGIELTKATEPVKVVDAAKEGEAVLVFTTLEVSGDRATVRYRWDVENVRGSCTLVRRDGRWELKSSRVTER